MSALQVIVLVAALPAVLGASHGGICYPGYMMEPQLCSGSAADSGSCQMSCCTMPTMPDSMCSTVAATCGTGKYYNSGTHGMTEANSNNFQEMCCVDLAQCSAYNCPDGYTEKSDADMCNMDTLDWTSCGTCCERISGTCVDGTMSGNECDAGTVRDDTAAGTMHNDDYQTNCCVAKAECSAYTCPTAYEKKDGADSMMCDDVLTDDYSCQSSCCQVMSGTCRDANSCNSGTTYDEAAAGTMHDGDFQANCCVAKANCDSYTCEAGTVRDSPYCMTSAYDAASCSSACCVVDETKCASNGGYNCGTGKYYNSMEHGGRTGTTAADCCMDKATCEQGECSPGYKKKDDLADRFCMTDSTSADMCNNDCCVVDETKCASMMTIYCGTGKMYDSAQHGTEATSDNFQTTCCADLATCAAYDSCAAGYKKRESPPDFCTTSDASSCESVCCMADDTKCAGNMGRTCGNDKVYDVTKNGMDYTADTYVDTCCMDVVTTCATYATDLMGMNGCVEGSYYDMEMHAMTAATEANMRETCCTAKATCYAGSGDGSTTSTTADDANGAAPGVVALLFSVTVLSSMLSQQ